MSIVTPDFIEQMLRTGALAEAHCRMVDGNAQPRNRAQWEKFTTWSLVCEEILDTEHSSDWYDDILAEFTRRGFNFEQVNNMRRFAWRTAGWLNYDKMLWEWVRLDEKDICTALAWQIRDGLISREQYEVDLLFLGTVSAKT